MATKNVDPEAQVVAMEVEGTPVEEEYEITHGLGIGYALVATTICNLIFAFLFPPIALITTIATIVLSSILTCRCCCAADYKLAPKTRCYAKTILFIIIAQLVLGIVAIAVLVDALGGAFGDVNWNDWDGEEIDVDGIAIATVVIAFWIDVVLDVCAIVIACLYTWRR